MSKTSTTAKILSNGSVVEVLDDGSERPFADIPMRPMTDDEIHAAALADPDAQPITPENEVHMRRTPQVRVIRRALKLSQEEFAARFNIPIGTLRDWEQGRKDPDAAARAYLKVIGRNPSAVTEALHPAL
jgi:putative transcriptional regulator